MVPHDISRSGEHDLPVPPSFQHRVLGNAAIVDGQPPQLTPKTIFLLPRNTALARIFSPCSGPAASGIRDTYIRLPFAGRFFSCWKARRCAEARRRAGMFCPHMCVIPRLISAFCSFPHNISCSGEHSLPVPPLIPTLRSGKCYHP